MTDRDTFGVMDWLRLLSTIAWLFIFVNWPQTTFAVTLVIIGGVFIAFNAMVFWITVVRKGHASSVAPILGGVIAAAGIALLPVAGSWNWAWVPLVIDWGGFPIFLAGWYTERSKS
ncbi:MAG: hypothetical protein GWP69_06780 [Gammaproteobacteria bacterium]|jgi:hypothetical protein|nr:hypothetical protein [Gammaproteobacteria bacterium]NCF79969.1 hypothetical protein [Pseudomonadota bacterium]